MTLDIYYYGFYENFLLPLNGSWIDPQPSPCKFVFARYENRCHAVEMAVARRIEHENNVIYSQINNFFFFFFFALKFRYCVAFYDGNFAFIYIYSVKTFVIRERI